MPSQKIKPTRAKTAQKSIKSPTATTAPRSWRTYLYYGLALVWGLITVKAYLAIVSTSLPVPAVEPHPIVDSSYRPDFQDALFTSLVPLVPLAMCVLSILAIRFVRWRWVILTVQALVVTGLLVHIQATSLWHTSLRSFTPQVQTSELDDTIVRRLQCGDAVRTVDNYAFGAKTFYDLKDQGYKLVATYSSLTGMLNSEADCNTYYNVRSRYLGEHIVLQLFTYDENNTPGPYLYKYAGQKNVGYGIFAKE